MTEATALTAAVAEAFLFREARLLDAGELRAWQELLTDDVIHWVPVNDEAADPKTNLSVVYDRRKQVDNRVWRVLESGLNHTQEPRSKTLRFVSNVECEAGPAPNEALVRCNLLLYEFRSGAQRRNVVPNVHPARCEYILRADDGGWKIARKKVVFLLLDAPLPPMSFLI